MIKTPPKRADSNIKKETSYFQPCSFSQLEQMHLDKTGKTTVPKGIASEIRKI